MGRARQRGVRRVFMRGSACAHPIRDGHAVDKHPLVLTHSTHDLFAKGSHACELSAARGELYADRVEEAAAIRRLLLQRRTLEEHVLRANTGGMLLDHARHLSNERSGFWLN